MRIGVDACCWSNKRGFGRFTRELLSAMIAVDDRNEYLFFADQDTARESEFPKGVEVFVAATSVSPAVAASASGRRSLKDMLALSRQVLKQDMDLFFFPAVYSYFPIFNRTKVVVTVHDMIADNHPASVFPEKKLKFFWKSKQFLAVRQSHLILTVSEYSKAQITNYFNLKDSRVKAISEGPSQVFTVQAHNGEMSATMRRYQLDSGARFLLYVGGISPHKNLHALVGAYHQLTHDSKFADVKLVLVGDYKNDSFYSAYPSLKRYIEELGINEKVIFTGFINDQDLAYLYNAATLLVLPSFEEGFGLPAVEAMTCGVPVVSSDRGSLPEVLGEAGRFFNPYDQKSMVVTLENVLGDDRQRKEMRERGLKRAQQFTWNKAARDTLAIFDSVVG